MPVGATDYYFEVSSADKLKEVIGWANTESNKTAHNFTIAVSNGFDFDFQDTLISGNVTLTTTSDTSVTIKWVNISSGNQEAMFRTGNELPEGTRGKLTILDNGTGRLTLQGTNLNEKPLIRNAGIFIMRGGNLTGNTMTSSSDCPGGGAVCNLGEFYMYDGIIINNTVKNSDTTNGGYGGGTYVHDNSEFYMYGGTITNNVAERYGGGVYIASGFNGKLGGSFSMYGGNITENTATENGGGIYAHVDDENLLPTITLSGSPRISGNKNSSGALNNVYLGSDNSIRVNITINGVLTPREKIGITVQNPPASDGEPVEITGVCDSANLSAFISDDSTNYNIRYNSTKQKIVLASLTYPYTVNWYNGTTLLETNSSVPYNVIPVYTKQNPIKADDELYNYTFAGWAATDGGELLSQLQPTTADANYYANFTKIRLYNLTWDFNGGSTTDDTYTLAGKLKAGDSIVYPEDEKMIRDGYTFSGWSVSELTMPAYDLTIKAEWTENPAPLPPEPDRKPQGSSVWLTETPTPTPTETVTPTPTETQPTETEQPPKDEPPYLLYGVLGVLIVLVIIVAVVLVRRRG